MREKALESIQGRSGVHRTGYEQCYWAGALYVPLLGVWSSGFLIHPASVVFCDSPERSDSCFFFLHSLVSAVCGRSVSRRVLPATTVQCSCVMFFSSNNSSSSSSSSGTGNRPRRKASAGVQVAVASPPTVDGDSIPVVVAPIADAGAHRRP